jgi:hypothetical protein
MDLYPWFQVAEGERSDFEYSSMESDEPSLIWIRRADGSAWTLGAVHQNFDLSRPFALTELTPPIQRFITMIFEAVRDRFGVSFASRVYDLML